MTSPDDYIEKSENQQLVVHTLLGALFDELGLDWKLQVSGCIGYLLGLIQDSLNIPPEGVPDILIRIVKMSYHKEEEDD